MFQTRIQGSANIDPHKETRNEKGQFWNSDYELLDELAR